MGSQVLKYFGRYVTIWEIPCEMSKNRGLRVHTRRSRNNFFAHSARLWFKEVSTMTGNATEGGHNVDMGP